MRQRKKKLMISEAVEPAVQNKIIVIMLTTQHGIVFQHQINGEIPKKSGILQLKMAAELMIKTASICPLDKPISSS